jgi:hypothetical protein
MTAMESDLVERDYGNGYKILMEPSDQLLRKTQFITFCLLCQSGFDGVEM